MVGGALLYRNVPWDAQMKQSALGGTTGKGSLVFQNQSLCARCTGLTTSRDVHTSATSPEVTILPFLAPARRLHTFEWEPGTRAEEQVNASRMDEQGRR